MSIYRREIDTQCCTAWMHGIRTINGQYPDDNRDFDINAGNGIRIQPATGGITIINDASPSSFVEGDNIEITPSGDDLVIGLVSDPIINGDLQVNGDIIQNGSAYETHAEQVYTTKDYIITRDGAISALSAGDYSGFQVKKYDGTNDGRLVIDNSGVARVGDVGDEQPLMTRDESASLTNGDLLQWNATSQKAVDAGVNTSQIVRGSGNIGSDTKPIKIVGGVATIVTDALATELYASNPNQLINNVNDWLDVDLNNRNADVNRTTILTESVTTNRPQQSGEGVYCYFGTRIVFWQATGFVTILAIGQGNDSTAHMWVNNYNANLADWGGWRRAV